MVGARSKSSIAVGVGGASDLAGSIEVRNVKILPFGTRRAGCLGTGSRPLFVRASSSGGSCRLFYVVALFILFLAAGGYGKEKEGTNDS